MVVSMVLLLVQSVHYTCGGGHDIVCTPLFCWEVNLLPKFLKWGFAGKEGVIFFRRVFKFLNLMTKKSLLTKMFFYNNLELKLGYFNYEFSYL